VEFNHIMSITSSVEYRSRTYIDVALFLVLFLLSLCFVYFLPQAFSRIFFLLLLALFLLSKKDYFWFAFFFVLAQGPGYFFSDYSGLSLQRLPLYTFAAGMSFTPIDIFVFLALVKALMKGRRTKLKLEKPLLALLGYIVFSIFVTSLIFGTSIDVIAWNVRWIFYYSIIISFLSLLNKKHDIYNFAILVFPFVFFILFTQIYFVVTGNEFINIFNPEFRWIAMNSVTGALRPVMGGVLILFFAFVFALLMLGGEKYSLPRIYLYLVMSVSFLSVFLSATRLWFVIFSVVLLGYILVSRKKFLSSVGIVAIFCVVLSTLLYFGVIPLDFLITSSWGRLYQVFNILRGDVYAIDTARNRLLNQLPVIVDTIRQNPFLGYGFSFTTMASYDNDFGFLNTILLFGINGFLLFLFFFFRLFATLSGATRNLSSRNPYRTMLKILIVAWLGVLIGYFTTWDFFTYYSQKVFFISILIAISEFTVRHSRSVESSLEMSGIRPT